MPEESPSPEAQDELPQNTATAKPAKKAKKKVDQEPGQSEKADSANAAEPAATDSRPPIKRNVRGTKKAATKKSGKREGNDGDSNESDANAGERSDSAGTSKQARRGRGRGRSRQDQPQQDDPKVKLDSKTVTKRAWKIFLGEVNEEGLALIADKDARELARRSLRVAEIYCHEEALVAEKDKGKKSK